MDKRFNVKSNPNDFNWDITDEEGVFPRIFLKGRLAYAKKICDELNKQDLLLKEILDSK